MYNTQPQTIMLYQSEGKGGWEIGGGGQRWGNGMERDFAWDHKCTMQRVDDVLLSCALGLVWLCMYVTPIHSIITRKKGENFFNFTLLWFHCILQTHKSPSVSPYSLSSTKVITQSHCHCYMAVLRLVHRFQFKNELRNSHKYQIRLKY